MPIRRLAVWAGIGLVGYLPLLTRFGSEQWARPQYEFFPLILVAAAYLAWERIHELPAGRLACGSPRLTWVLAILSLLMILAASVLWSGRLAAVSALVALVAAMWRFGGPGVLRATIPALILLTLVIGLPVGLDEPFLQQLRQWAVWTSSGLLIWLNVPHLATGTVIEIPGSRLLVAEACSGINSLMAVLAFTLLLGFWRRRTPLVIALLVIAASVCVLWANMLRIAGGALLKANWQVDILSGAAHAWASMVMFIVSMGIVFSVDQLVEAISRWLAGRHHHAVEPAEEAIAIPDPASTSAATLLRITPAMWVFSAIFALTGIAQVANATTHGGLRFWLSGAETSRLPANAVFSLPPQAAGWQQSEDAAKLIAQPEIEGKHSQTWAFRRGDLTAVVAIAYPFAGYHDLTVCYRNAGWTVQAQADKLGQPGDPGAHTIARLGRLSESGYAWFASLDESGRWAEPPKETMAGRVSDRVRHMGRPDWNAPTCQVQVWVQSFAPISPQDQDQLTELFQTVRLDLAQQVVRQLEGR